MVLIGLASLIWRSYTPLWNHSEHRRDYIVHHAWHPVTRLSNHRRPLYWNGRRNISSSPLSHLNASKVGSKKEWLHSNEAGYTRKGQRRGVALCGCNVEVRLDGPGMYPVIRTPLRVCWARNSYYLVLENQCHCLPSGKA